MAYWYTGIQPKWPRITQKWILLTFLNSIWTFKRYSIWSWIIFSHQKSCQSFAHKTWFTMTNQNWKLSNNYRKMLWDRVFFGWDRPFVWSHNGCCSILSAFLTRQNKLNNSNFGYKRKKLGLYLLRHMFYIVST